MTVVIEVSTPVQFGEYGDARVQQEYERCVRYGTHYLLNNTMKRED